MKDAWFRCIKKKTIPQPEEKGFPIKLEKLHAVNVAQSFNENLGIDGVVLTKLDGTAKGGIVLAIKEAVDIPVKFVGLGEREKDLRTFDIEKYIYGLFKDMM